MVRFGQSVGIGDTLQQALDQVFQGSSGGNTGEGGSADGNTPTGKADNPAATKALSEAQQRSSAADKALTEGDLATYQKRIQEAQGAVQRALRARSLSRLIVALGSAVSAQRRGAYFQGACCAAWRYGGLVRGADFEIGKANSAERVGQTVGIPDHHEGELIRMDDRAVGLGGCIRCYRTQQREASIDVVVGKTGENLGGG